MRNKILITGGAGYIGSYLCSKLSKNYDLIIVDNLVTGSVKNLKFGKFHNVDISNYKKLNSVFDKYKIDLVIHLAALVKVDESILKPNKYWKTNLLGTLNILNCMKNYNIKKILFASTAAVYEASNEKLNESNKIKFINPYGETKFLSEELIKLYSNLFKMNSIVFRFFNVSGANIKKKIGERVKPPTHFITILINNLIKNRYTTIFRGLKTFDKSGIRDYVHVDDICEAFVKAIKVYMNNKKNKNIFQVFNLGTGKGNSTFEVVSAAMRLIKNKKFLIKKGNKRIGDQSIVVCDFKKAKKYLKWRPKNSKLNKIILSSYMWEKYLINEK